MNISTQKQEKLTPEQKWEQATLANNFIFYKVMRHHPDACQYLIEMLLNVKIEKMEMHSEEMIDIDHDSKGIRLDVYVRDTNKMYDIELQTTDTKELPERARYYQDVMDLSSLNKGDFYKDLKDSYVIFICLEDIFHKGLPVYTFENICREDLNTKLNDRTQKCFFIADICAKMIKDEEARSFFEFLISNKVNSNYTKDLNEYVIDAKHNTQWRVQYMTWERQQAYAFQNGKEEKAKEDAISFYKNGASIELIAKSLDMTIEQVKELVRDVETVEQNAQVTGLSVEEVQEIAEKELVTEN